MTTTPVAHHVCQCCGRSGTREFVNVGSGRWECADDTACRRRSIHAARRQKAARAPLAELPTLENTRFLADIPKLKPYEPADGLTSQQWALGDPQCGYVVYSRGGAKIRLDLSPSKQRFAANWINPTTGKFTPLATTIDGGKMVELDAPGGGPCVLWLTHD